MPIIAKIGRKSARVKMFIGTVYVILAIGAVTMIYPFLLMISSSITSGVDSNEYRLIPRYVYNDEALLKKYIQIKYSYDITQMNEAYGTDYIRFEDIKLGRLSNPDEVTGRMVNDWQIFKSNLPPEYKTCYFRAAGGRFDSLYLYRNFIRARYGNNIELVNNLYTEENENFDQLVDPYPENLLWQEWEPTKTRKVSDWYEFKSKMPPSYMKVVAGDPYYQKYLKSKYRDIEKINVRWGTDYPSFSRISLPEVIPSHSVQAEDWNEFVKTKWPERYTDRSGGSVKVRSAENLYRAYLYDKYKRIDTLNKAYGMTYPDFSSISPPYKKTDGVELSGDLRKWRWHFVTKNYEAVINFILVHGRSLVNTAILCIAMIITTVTINPLCAYALSRFKLPYTHKILLFLLATMAFPAEVSMIPGFLLLKNFHLLNTYWALILPGAANGFSIFLLKGFFDSLPEELYETALIEGANEIQMFWKITVPLSKPVLAVLSLGAFGAAYGSFMWALIVCQNKTMWTLMVFLYEFQISSPKFLVTAALVIAALPTLVVFLFCQKVIMKGIIIPAFK